MPAHSHPNPPRVHASGRQDSDEHATGGAGRQPEQRVRAGDAGCGQGHEDPHGERKDELVLQAARGQTPSAIRARMAIVIAWSSARCTASW